VVLEVFYEVENEGKRKLRYIAGKDVKLYNLLDKFLGIVSSSK
jgi:hypothetical protein